MDGDRARTADESTIAYAYRPSLFGAAWEFALTDTGVDWVAGSNPAGSRSATSAPCACRTSRPT